ncbi:hypothetical protein EHW61_15755 [Salinivibrio sp. VYel6]|uniref:hypothetical protein n=1 Tax=Salinivibrio sp. VYel6 TaxID=2490493 RepID=UPI00128E3C37|nr:hypothetical protein [Salinivibrio sp. VYel6]MPX98090.1 hypothetical protein [Salinivibrio sp. VYel6]
MTKPAESVRLPNGMTPVATEYAIAQFQGADGTWSELAVCRLETGHIAVAIPTGWIWKGMTLRLLEERDDIPTLADKVTVAAPPLYDAILKEHGLLGGAKT